MNIPNAIKRNAMDSSLEITIRVGKLGINDSVIDELKQQLKKRKLVKVKVNQGVANGSSERNELFSLISSSSESTLVFQRGNIAVFWSGM
ncbi:MAG: YhbY family RNA-binding protein [Candidatus Thalassarchaeaceae archaeon]|nr:YhbY family RNA-binding protein [Euryarchaeota archaeon]MDG1548409.1 YhbY family RNA-binding protein [Candidatus Thalassarchaeaceae archaeon]MDG1553795.1 YhbY family RNA-binding protein [Candidatus Thalassarchaeaceae archaeon]|tara:strand:+ start:977 stop:1246 length:270 start_codon:yes stop_codon:yes gene_type:complete